MINSRVYSVNRFFVLGRIYTLERLLRQRHRLLALALMTGLLLLGFAALPAPAAQAQETTAVVAVDNTPPAIPVLADILAPATDGLGAVVTYLPPVVTDDVDGPVAPVCEPVSGTLFPLGTTPVTCTAWDSAGNESRVVAFNIIVTDQHGPAIEQPANLSLTASDPTGMAVSYAVPGAYDNVSGPVPVSCTPGPGAWFAIGSTVVTCSAADAIGNLSSVTFTVAVEAPAEPPAVETETAVPTEPAEAAPTETAPSTDADEEATDEPEGDDPTESVATPSATVTETATETASPTPSPTPSPSPVTTPAALALPWPPPPPATPIYGSGPIDGLAMIWGGLSFPVSQEYGHTEFSLAQQTLYLYGLDLGLDGRAHPGLDIGMPAGTYLYSPVDGTVIVSGGVPYYTYYGNGEPGVGELLIETDAGDHVILGHMAAISVQAGQRVSAGDFVGLSGGDNGDHLHLETRAGGYSAVDPRQSFLIPAITAYNTPNDEAETATTSDATSDTAQAADARDAEGSSSDPAPADEPVAATDEPANDGAAAAGDSSNLLDALLYEPDSPSGSEKQELIGEFLESRSVTSNEASSSG